MKKRILTLALAFALVLGITPAFAVGVSPFADVSTTHWAYADIVRAYDDGIVNGTGTNAAGQAVYSPSSTLSTLQFIAILARGFYKDEVEAKPYENWFNREVETLQDHNINYWFALHNPTIDRDVMAMMIYKLMQDQGAPMPSTMTLDKVKGMITDMDTVREDRQDAVAACFYFGIINGTSKDPIRFSGKDSMKRDAAAAVYVRIKDTIAALKNGTFKPSIEPENGGAVGTMSDTKLTIDSSWITSHAPITDYWSQQSAYIQSIADRDHFNAACQTIKDSRMIMNEGEFGPIAANRKTNFYYNYAVVPYSEAQTQRNVSVGMSNMVGAGGNYGGGGGYLSGYVYYTISNFSEDQRAALAPYAAKAMPGMTDRQRAEIAIQAVVDRIDYEVDGGAFWSNDKRTGDCESYAMMIHQLLAAVDVPSIFCAAEVAGGGHAWLQAKIDGQWYVIDGTMAESGFSNGGIMPFAEHEKAFDYDHSKNDWPAYQVARALIDAAYPEF